MELGSIATNIGVSGVALWILWKMYDSSQKRFKEKDQELIIEIDKRDKRNDAQQQTFANYTTKIHDSTTKQLAENTKALSNNAIALQDNTKVMRQVSEHLNQPHNQQPVIIQNNTGTATPDNKN